MQVINQVKIQTSIADLEINKSLFQQSWLNFLEQNGIKDGLLMRPVGQGGEVEVVGEELKYSDIRSNPSNDNNLHFKTNSWPDKESAIYSKSENILKRSHEDSTAQLSLHKGPGLGGFINFEVRPYVLEYVEKVYGGLISQRLSFSAKQYPEQYIGMILNGSKIQFWVRDTSIDKESMTLILKELRSGMSKLGLSLSGLTLNGKTIQAQKHPDVD